MDLLCRTGCPHKAEQSFQIGAVLDVDQVHAVAAGAVRGKFMLSQQGFKVPGQIGGL